MPRIREFRWGSWLSWAERKLAQDAPSVIAVDTETTGLEFWDEAFAATLTWRTPGGALRSAYVDLADTGGPARAWALGDMLRKVPAWVGHNWKFDAQKLILAEAITREDIDAHEIHDTQTLFHLLDENSPKALKTLAATVLKVDDTIEVEIQSGPNKGKTKRVPKEAHRLNETRRKLKLRKEDGYHLLPREVLIPYALRDTEFTLRLFEVLMPRLEGLGDPDLLQLYRDEIELLSVLLDMEAEGLGLDVPYTEKTASEYGVRAMEAWNRVSALTGNPELNPQSPDQLRAAFRARGLRLADTQESTIKGLDDDLARAILDFRQVSKIHKVYLRGLLDMQRDGVVHPNFNPTGARTGRMSSGSAKE